MKRSNCKANLNKKFDVDILFIIPPFHMRNGGGSFFPLGLGYIISMVESYGFTWGVVNCTKYINSFYPQDLDKLSTKIKEALLQYSPSVIGIGPCITTQLRALKIISSTCQHMFPDVPVFAGGPLASIEDQEWLFYEELGIKFLIKGDGEMAVVDAIQNIKRTGDISNSKCVSTFGYSYMNFIEDINIIPFPYRQFNKNEKFSIRRSKKETVQAAMITSRGCPYNCNYCVSGNLKYNNIKYRKRSVANIVDEIYKLNHDHNVNDIVFYDDCFFHNPKTVNLDVLNFCTELESKQIHITWQIEMRPDIFCELSEESIYNLQKNGCRQISLGIEKISEKGLAFLGKQNCWLKLERQIAYIKKVSTISISATFILGGKNETLQDIMLLIEKSKDLPLDFAHYNPLFIYPGTPIYSTIFDNKKEWAKIIQEDDLPWGEIVFENEFLKRDQLIMLVNHAYAEFYKNSPYAKQQMIVDRFNIKEKL